MNNILTATEVNTSVEGGKVLIQVDGVVKELDLSNLTDLEALLIRMAVGKI